MAEAQDAPLDLVDLAQESGELIEVVDERLRTLEDLGLLLDGREVGVGVPPLLLRAGRQYLRARGGVRPEVLAFAPRVIDDLHAREALLEASAVLVDDFGDAIAEGNAVAFAISVVPPEARSAMTPRLAVALYGAAVALIARLVDGEPAACVAEEVLAVALLNEARSWLYEADLDTTERSLRPRSPPLALLPLRGLRRPRRRHRPRRPPPGSTPSTAARRQATSAPDPGAAVTLRRPRYTRSPARRFCRRGRVRGRTPASGARLVYRPVVGSLHRGRSPLSAVLGSRGHQRLGPAGRRVRGRTPASPRRLVYRPVVDRGHREPFPALRRAPRSGGPRRVPHSSGLRCVGLREDAVGHRLRRDELELQRLFGVGVEAGAGAEDHREDLEVDLVDQAGDGEQRVGEGAGAGDEEVAVGGVLQLRRRGRRSRRRRPRCSPTATSRASSRRRPCAWS